MEKLITTEIKTVKLNPEAVMPTYGTEFSAGADLYYCGEDVTVAPGGTVKCPTGLSFEIPTGLGGFIFARSGLSCKRHLAPANKVGVIDSDYRGEIIVMLHNHGNTTQIVQKGERIAQIVFMPYVRGIFTEAEELSDTERGNGGFGSTGKM